MSDSLFEPSTQTRGSDAHDRYGSDSLFAVRRAWAEAQQRDRPTEYAEALARFRGHGTPVPVPNDGRPFEHASGDVLDTLDLLLVHTKDPIRRFPVLVLPCVIRMATPGYCDGDWHHRRRRDAFNGWVWAAFERCPLSVAEAQAEKAAKAQG